MQTILSTLRGVTPNRSVSYSEMQSTTYSTGSAGSIKTFTLAQRITQHMSLPYYSSNAFLYIHSLVVTFQGTGEAVNAAVEFSHVLDALETKIAFVSAYGTSQWSGATVPVDMIIASPLNQDSTGIIRVNLRDLVSTANLLLRFWVNYDFVYSQELE